MKKIVASVGLVALGASFINTQQSVAAPAPAQPWSASATLRGFYDDNINATPDHKVSSFGYEISPSVGVNWGNDQTTLFANYTYSFKYYDKRRQGSAFDKYDQDHTFLIQLDHSFTERYQVSVRDSFVVGQEPDVLRSGSTFNTFQPVSGDNIRNLGSIVFNAQLTPLLGLELGYDNTFVDYADSGTNVLGSFSPSLSGRLDRIDQAVHIDGRWQLSPQTVGVLGYKFEQVDYTGNETIAFADPAMTKPLPSDVRNSRIHTVYVGADHTFRPDFSGSVRAGGQYVDHYNDSSSQSDFAPYVQASLSYAYAAESYLKVGFTQSRSATDVVGVDKNGKITQDVDSSVVYGSVRQRIVPSLFGSLVGTFQSNTFNGGVNDGKSEQFYLLGLDLEYQINHYLSAHTGYNYDKLSSDVPNRGFDRNRIYIGLTASY